MHSHVLARSQPRPRAHTISLASALNLLVKVIIMLTNTWDLYKDLLMWSVAYLIREQTLYIWSCPSLLLSRNGILYFGQQL
jgi:hypothetical protein